MRRCWIAAATLVCAALPVALAQAAAPTTIVDVASMPSHVAVNTSFRVRVRLTNRGPEAASAITVTIGLDKLAANGTNPGLYVTAKKKVRVASLAVGASTTVTLSLSIPLKPRGAGTFGALYFGPGRYDIGGALEIGAPTGTAIKETDRIVTVTG